MTMMDAQCEVKAQLSKTVLCTFHASGTCTKGTGCPFAHSDDELRTTPDLRKTSLCKAWKLGMCKQGASKCAFAHGVRDLRITPAFLARNKPKQERKISMQSKEAPAEGISGSQQLISKMEPDYLKATGTPTDFEQGVLPSTINSGCCMLFAPSAVIYALATTSCEDKVSLAHLSYALLLGASGMNEDHALEQRLLEVMPQYYED
mmetsp:Transcript_52675/g.83578  ORF Transcript_52675/g.83578 Transcript_52675/m.83578 type:complete len:205 (-) Transcript_52675:10-624(-)